MGWTVLDVLNWTTSHFKRHGVPTPRLDAEVLLADTLAMDRVRLYTSFDKPLTSPELTRFRARVKARCARKPVAYITGRKEFYALEFEVGPGCLIPRPDTEVLVEEAVTLLGRRKRKPQARHLPWRPNLEQEEAGEAIGSEEGDGANPEDDPAARRGGPAQEESGSDGSADAADTTTAEPPLVLDLCTGAGIIPICLARETPCRVIGVDIAPRAVQYAKKNVARYHLESQVAIVEGDLLQPVPRRFRGRFALVTANPPYLTPGMLDQAAPEINRYEPRTALLGGPDGLEVCRRIVAEAPAWMAPGGWLLIEIGTTAQARSVEEGMFRAGLVDCYTRNDLSGQVRVVVGRKPGSSSETA